MGPSHGSLTPTVRLRRRRQEHTLRMTLGAKGPNGGNRLQVDAFASCYNLYA
jgi:hypothetical protein